MEKKVYSMGLKKKRKKGSLTMWNRLRKGTRAKEHSSLFARVISDGEKGFKMGSEERE